ncbi:hypothetical protein J6590_071699 [Homalodisca vitripennis]|nr:hypothetical protein J6590_071699 [Homalodisca vitripennis]
MMHVRPKEVFVCYWNSYTILVNIKGKDGRPLPRTSEGLSCGKALTVEGGKCDFRVDRPQEPASILPIGIRAVGNVTPRRQLGQGEVAIHDHIRQQSTINPTDFQLFCTPPSKFIV